MTHESVVFDRAAESYDETRRLPPDVLAEVVRILEAELRRRGTCLEIGVGTGRIALPLHVAGVPMAGVDLSKAMLAKLVAKSAGVAPFPLARADATRLPFADDTFDAGLVCHVFHLIPRWREAAAELVRVVRPGGVILVDIDGVFGGGIFDDLWMQLSAFAGLESRNVGANGAGEVSEAMLELGARARDLEPVVRKSRAVLEAWFTRVESNVFSRTWPLTDDERSRAIALTREWARQRYGPLDLDLEAETKIAWKAYDVAGQATSRRDRTHLLAGGE